MAPANTELRNWHDWTDPDFFATDRQRESRFVPLFLRQILPRHLLQTRLTLTGWCLIFVSFGLGIAAYNTASNILFLTLSLLLSSLVLSGILSWINFRKLQWVLQAPTHLKVGEVGMAEVDLAINQDPEMLTARVVRTQLLEDLGRWDDALAELSNLRLRDPKNESQFDVWQARLVAGRDQALGNTPWCASRSRPG